jgi:hypothetical protein
MSEPANADAPSVARRRVDWNMITAAMAVLIGALALAVSAYTAHLQQMQVRAQVWPQLAYGFHGNERALIVENKGMGPLLLRQARLYVDGRPMRTWNEVFTTVLGAEAGVQAYEYTSLASQMLAPGDRVVALRFEDAALARRVLMTERSRLQFEFCVCSVLDECRGVSERDAASTGWGREAAVCPASVDPPFSG